MPFRPLQENWRRKYRYFPIDLRNSNIIYYPRCQNDYDSSHSLAAEQANTGTHTQSKYTVEFRTQNSRRRATTSSVTSRDAILKVSARRVLKTHNHILAVGRLRALSGSHIPRTHTYFSRYGKFDTKNMNGEGRVCCENLWCYAS